MRLDHLLSRDQTPLAMRREFPHKLPVHHIGAAARQRDANYEGATAQHWRLGLQKLGL